MASIKCRYLDGTSKICYTTDYVNDIKVNGVSIGLVTNYNVNSGDEVEFDVRYSSNTGSYGYNLFFGIKTLVSVEIGDEIDYVGSQMCTNCTALETLKIGSAVRSIHTSAFRNCTSLKTIDFTGASNLLQIQTQAFQNCTSLTRIDFPNTLNNVQPQAFQGCTSLKVISFGTDIKGFYRYAFSGCTSLDEIRIQNPECPQFLGTDGGSAFVDVKYGGTLYYPKGSDYSAWLNPNTLYSLGSQGWNGVETDDFEDLDRLKLVCKYNEGSLIFNPSYADSFIDVKINGVSVGDLEQYHYTTSDDDIVEFSLRGTSIGYRDFWGCDGLVDIKIDEGVTTIGEGVFNGCTSLLSITIPSTVTNIGNIAFGGCSALEAVYVKGQTCNIQPQTFKDVRRNGILYYPNGTNYSQWLSTDNYYLGYYGWNGVGVDSDFELKIYRFNIAVESLSIPQGGTVQQIEYTSLNIDEISIDAPSWINVVQYSTYFELTIAANTGDDRTGTITFTANPNSVNPIVDRVGVSQDGLDIIFVLGDGFNISYTFPKAGGTYQLPYTAQRISSITWIAPDWLTITNKGTYFNIVAPANSGDERSANIIFKADNIEREYHIYQDGIVPTFALDKSEVTVNPSGETFTVNYSGTDIKTVDWSISTNTGTDDWVNVVKHNGYFTITVASNTADVRKARVTFVANSGYANTASDTLVINQQALEKSFTLDDYLISFPSEGGVQDVGYDVVNIWDDITFEAPSWITVTIYNAVFRIEVGRTTSTTGRQGTVTFRTGGFVQELVVKQDKFTEPVITVSKTKIEAPYTGLTETVSYTTQGVESIYIISPNWIDVRDYGTYLEINVKDNAEYEERTGVVEVYGNYESAYEAQARIEVVQEPMAKPEISITPTQFNCKMDINFSNLIIDVTTNGEVTTHSDLSWCYVWTNETYKNKRYFFNCYDNDYAPRSGVIEFRATLGKLSESVYLTVTQEGAEFSIETDNIEVPYTGVVTTIDANTTGVKNVDIDSPDWVTVTTKSGYFEVDVDENSGNNRTGTVTFTAQPSGIKQTLLINQYSKESSDMATSIALYKTRLDYAAEGGSGYVQVDYTNPNTINTPYCSQSWVTIERTQQGTTNAGVVQHQYRITMAPTSYARQANVKFSCTNASGAEISNSKLVLYQSAPVEEETKEYIIPNVESLTFDYTGEPSQWVQVNWNGDFADKRVGASHSWITVGNGQTVSGTTIKYPIYLSENTDTARSGGVSFTGLSDGENRYAGITIYQDGAAEAKTNAFTTTMKVKSDGTPEMSSNTKIRCGYQAVTVGTPEVDGDWIHIGTGTRVSGTFYGYDTVMEYPISFDSNLGSARVGTVTFKGTDGSGNVLNSVCVVTQAAYQVEPDEPEIPVDGEEYIGPIWKDIEFDFGGIDMVEYGIYTTTKVRLPGNAGMVDIDNLLFAGRSYARPNDGSNKILVNQICKTYMEAPLLNEDAVAVGGGYGEFKLKSADGNTTYRIYKFVNDWSYSNSFMTGVLSHPILNNDRKVFKNQLLPFTVFGANESVNVVYGIQYGGKKNEYGETIQDWSNMATVKNGVETEIFPYSGRSEGAISYTIDGNKYLITDECVQYVLYYVNPWGGYDWFPIRGKVVEKDSMTAYTYTQNFNNQTLDFGKKKYLGEIQKHFTLHTQWMSEDESSRMWYLLQSNTVYLHNLVEDKIYPVVITNTEQEHKKRLLGTRISYQIEVDLSQIRERI